MKQVLLFGFALILTAVGIGFYMRPASPSTIPKDDSKTKVVTLFTLYKISGEVFYKRDTDNNFSLLEGENVMLPNHTIVKTTVGKATVLFEDKSMITLRENTQIEVNQSEQGFSIKQFFGKTYHRVETLVTGKSYEVRTPTTLAAVRGTKFAIVYDETKKETKVTVTEHKVAINEIDSMLSTSTPNEDPSFVEEGKTATVKNGGGDEGTTVTDTKKDKEMQGMIDEEAAMDEVYEDIKQSSTKEDFKRRVENIMLKEEEKKGETEKSIQVDNKIEDPKKETKNVVDDQVETIKSTTTPVVKKMDEEVFFTAFEPLFIKLFYIDEQNTPCTFKGTATDRVKQVASFASEGGYPLMSTSNLTVFAEDITKYCSTKDKDQYNALQKRFDAEYPYQQ